jgi:hypothetical protein
MVYQNSYTSPHDLQRVVRERILLGKEDLMISKSVTIKIIQRTASTQSYTKNFSR